MTETPNSESNGAAPPPPGGWKVEHDSAPAADGASADAGTGSSTDAEQSPPTATATAVAEPPAAPPKAPSGTGSADGEGGRRRPRGAFVGIVLVFVGVLLLAANFVPGWTFGQWWPVIIILLGLFNTVSPKGKKEPRINKVMDGLVLAAIGVVLLGCTTGYLAWTVWWSIFSLWPVLVISLGLSILGRGIGQRWLGAIGSLFVLAALLYGAFVMPAGGAGMPFGWRSTQGGVPFEQRVATPGDRASLQIESGVGECNIASSDAGGLSIEGTSPKGAAPTITQVASESSTAPAFRVSAPERSSIGTPEGTRLDVLLDKSLLWAVEMDSGVTSTRADFTENKLESLTLDGGVSSTTVWLGAETGPQVVPVDVRGGVSNIEIIIPSSTAATVYAEGGLTGLSIAGLEKTDEGTWVTPEAAKSPNQQSGYKITIDSGVSTVRVSTQ